MATRSAAIAIVVVAIACSPVIDTGVIADQNTTGVSGGVASTLPTSTADSATSGDPIDDTSGGVDGSTTSAASDETTGGGPTTTGSTGDTEGGGGPVGSPCGSEQKVCALALLDGEPAGSCGTTLDIKGITQPIGPNLWSLQDCGSCELCGGPSYTIEFFAPDDWAPELPLCTHMAIDFAPMDQTVYACAFEGVAIWEDDGLGEDPAPVYVGASIVTDVPTGVAGLLVIDDNVMPEDCVKSGCCPVDPGDYELTFEGAGIDPPVVLAEKDIALDVSVFSRPYDLHDVRSHAHKECGKVPHFDWIIRRQ